MARQCAKLPFLSFIKLFLVFMFSMHIYAASIEDGEVLVMKVTEDSLDSGNPCSKMESKTACPVNCFHADPVCGIDGVTYWCGCQDALCNGAQVAKRGPCDVGNGGSSSLPGQALLLIHIVWLVLLGFSLLFGFF